MNKFSITILPFITERDFKTEYLFRMCSVVTNLVTSLELQPTRCATMLCHFGRTQKSYVATRFILLNSTAESGATGGHVVVPVRFGQSEARASRNVEWTRKNLSFVSNFRFNQRSMSPQVNVNFIFDLYVLYFMYFFSFRCRYFIFSLWKT